MRPLQDWNETDLAQFIRDATEESLTLDYKGAGAISRDGRKMIEITKDVSAMANSAGGLIIYGLAEFADKSKKHLPERLDPIVRSQFSKEWLEQVIAQIQPRIVGLRIHPIRLSSNSDHVAYVVEIPVGTTAHQASDFRYYRRYNFEAVPMLDHEVRDVMNRKTHPRLIVGAKLVVWPKSDKDGNCGRLVFDLYNDSDVFARYVVLVVHAPIRILGRPAIYENAPMGEIDGCSGFKLVFSNHNEAPLFPHARISPYFDFRFMRQFLKEPPTPLGHYAFDVFADSMPRITGKFTPDEILCK